MLTEWILGGDLVFSYLLASFLIWRGARKLGWSEEKVIDIILLVVILSLAGARLGFIFTNWKIFTVSPIRGLLLFKYPGLSFFSGIAAGIVALTVLGSWRRIPILPLLDLFSLPLMFSAAVLLFSCRFLTCSAINSPRIILALSFLVLSLIFLSRLQKFVLDSPRAVKLKFRYGLIFVLCLGLSQLLSLLLAKSLSSSLYSIYKLLFALEFIALFFYFQKYFTMIRIPASVLTQIKDYLEDKLRNTEKNLTELKREDPATDRDRLHEESSDDDVATNKARHEKVQALQLQLTKSVVELCKALSKIKVGSYGICEVCGRMIDTDRLAANPSATLCLDDERKKEKSKR